MKKTLIFSLILLNILFLTACKKKDPIVGKWAHGSFIYTFNSNGTCNYDAAGTNMECTYKIEKDKLTIQYKGTDAPFETKFKIEGNTLHVLDSFGTDTTYEKK